MPGPLPLVLSVRAVFVGTYSGGSSGSGTSPLFGGIADRLH